MNNLKSIAFFLTLVCLSVFQVHAVEACADTAVAIDLKLAGVFQDNAVLQRDIDLPVWGTAHVGSTVTVTYDNQQKTTTANQGGAWRVELEPLQAVPSAAYLIDQGLA